MSEVRRYVYFVRAASGRGNVKIGSSATPTKRLEAFMAWAPEPLEIVATIKGGFEMERAFHTLFADSHSHREWFRPSAELEAVMAAVKAGTFDPSTLPAPRVVTRRYIYTDVRRKRLSFTHRLRWAFDERGLLPPPGTARLVPLAASGDADARETLEAYLADPERHGTAPAWEWAVAKRAKWAQRHPLPQGASHE